MSTDVLAISGAPADEWAEYFLPCAKFDTNGNLLRGSIGISFSTRVDLSDLFYEKCGGDETKFESELQILCPTNSMNRIHQLMRFFKFAEGIDRIFVIKKGTKAAYVVRRLGHYRFDASKDYPHRISYEFVRLPNDDEKHKSLSQCTVAPIKLTA